MHSGRTPQQTINTLRAGPGANIRPLTAMEVAEAAEKLPKKYAGAMSALLYKLADSQLKAPGKNMVTKFKSFSQPWLSELSDIRAKFFAGYLDAFSTAVESGLSTLEWKDQKLAQEIEARILPKMPSVDSIQGLAWIPMIGQIQSTYSRDLAAKTFASARSHVRSELIADFYWDTGALTYYSEEEVKERRRTLPSLSEMRTLNTSDKSTSSNAIVISMDPDFFRIYGPMILFNAQQLASIDFVLLLSDRHDAAGELLVEARDFMNTLSTFNKQEYPSNVRIQVLDMPHCVGNERTFYACARFLALPELLSRYEKIYTMDADLFMVQDPRPFMSATFETALSAPETQGLLGLPPWRRYMAGNVIADRSLIGSRVLKRLLDYLSVGLAESSSWMLDQNAIAYAVEGSEPGEFARLSKPRPSVTGSFMRLWERNYKAATR